MKMVHIIYTIRNGASLLKVKCVGNRDRSGTVWTSKKAYWYALEAVF